MNLFKRNEREPPNAITGYLAGARVLVTGGLGLIGSHLARKLIALGSEVLLLDNLDPGCGGNLRNIADLERCVDIIYSATYEPYEVLAAVARRDYIFNLAGISSHMDSMNFPLVDLQTNCGGVLTLLDACRQLSSKATIIFASTRQVYGRPRYLPVDEAHPTAPVDVNGIHRIAAEHYHALYQQAYGLNTRILRLTNTYGPGMRVKDGRQMFLGIWLLNLMLGQPIEVWDGHQQRDLLHAGDAAEALLAAATAHGLSGQIFNIGGSPGTSLTTLAQMLIAENDGVGTYLLREFPKDRKAIEIGDFITDDWKFRQVTGWAPSIDLSAGLRETITYYRDNIRHYL